MMYFLVNTQQQAIDTGKPVSQLYGALPANRARALALYSNDALFPWTKKKKLFPWTFFLVIISLKKFTCL